MTLEVNDKILKGDKLQNNRIFRFSIETKEESVQTPVVKYSLPTVESPQRESSAFRSISAQSLAGLLRQRCLHILIFDCRYPYEYFGGHIKGAVNIYSLDDLEKYLFDEFGVKSTLVGLLPIFYCEYSQVRGPAMARRLRKIDIEKNDELHFPEIYLLDKGYMNFWSHVELRDLCEPCYYISMHARPYKHTLRQYTQHRSKSTADGRKTKKDRLHVFSNEHLLDEEPPVVETVRASRARTPRVRLLFE